MKLMPIAIMSASCLAPVLAQTARLPVPPLAERDVACRELQRKYKSSYADSPIELATSMLASAQKDGESPTRRFALLVESRRLSVQAFHYSTAMLAIEELARSFDLMTATPPSSEIKLKIETLRPKKPQLSRDQHQEANRWIFAVLHVAAQCTRTGDFDTAIGLARDSRKFSKRMKLGSMARLSRSVGAEAERIAKQFKGLASARSLLTTKPDDPSANHVVGSFDCFLANDWELGMIALSKAKSSNLRWVARGELSPPSTPEQMLALASEWANLLKRSEPHENRLAHLNRAARWYELAREQRSGLEAIAVANQVASLWQQHRPEVIDLIACIDTRQDAIKGKWTVLGGILLNQIQKPGWSLLEVPMELPEEYDLTIAVEPRSPEGRSFGFGIIYGGRRAHINLSGPTGLGLIDGKKSSENKTTIGRAILRTGKPVVIRTAVRKTGVTVKCGRKVLIQWKGNPQRLTLSGGLKTPHKKAMFVGGNDEVLIHEMSLRPVKGDGRPLWFLR